MSTPTAQAYNDGALQYGAPGLTVISYGASSTRGTFLIEEFTPSYPTSEIERPDQVGGPNGFVDVNKQAKANCTIQLGVAGAAWPQNGDWFIYAPDPSKPGEKWVIANQSTPQQMNGYWKSTFTAKKTTLS